MHSSWRLIRGRPPKPSHPIEDALGLMLVIAAVFVWFLAITVAESPPLPMRRVYTFPLDPPPPAMKQLELEREFFPPKESQI